MTTSKQNSTVRLVSNKWIIALIFLSFVGFTVSAYLTANHYLGELPACSVIKGCEEVTTSKYSTVMGVPISLFGAGYFLSLLVLLIAYIDMKKAGIIKLFALLTLPGALISITLLWLQFAVLKAICIYCLAADVSVLLITASAVFLYLKFFKTQNGEQ